MLRLLAAAGPMRLTEVASALDLPKGTAHGLLRTLQGVDFVEQDADHGPYRIGRGLRDLETRWDLNDIRGHAIHWSDALAARTGEAVRVAALRDDAAVVAHHVFRADSSPQRLDTGNRLPLHATALGKVLLAHDERAAMAVTAAGLEEHTYRTITDPVALRAHLVHVREAGWAAAVGETDPDAAGLAAPVRDRTGHVVAAVGIGGATDDLCDVRFHPRPDLVREVIRAGHAISRELGHGRLS